MAYEFPILNQEQENLPLVEVPSKALVSVQLSKQILFSKKNTIATTKFKNETFILKGTDSDYVKSQNATINSLSTNCFPPNDGSQLLVSDSDTAKDFKTGRK